MNNWEILALPPTDDRDTIRQAYMTMLPQYNPEDDPEGFLRLRTAYEEILKELDSNQEAAETPHTIFMKQVEEVYNDFQRRCNVSEWKKLLDSQVCQRLDMVDEAENMLLIYLIDNFNLPMDVWAALAIHFDWASREAVLKQSFPYAFIDYVIRKSMEEEIPKYELFAPAPGHTAPIEAHQYDQWLSVYFEMYAMVNTDQANEPYISEKQAFIEKQAQLEAIPLYHPYYYGVVLAGIAMQEDAHDEAMAIIEPIRQKYPDDIHIWCSYSAALSAVGKREEAIAEFEKILARDPGFIYARRSILNAQIKLERYEAANATMTQILEAHPYDYFALSKMQDITGGLAKIYEAKHAANPSDIEVLLRLAEHYAKNRQIYGCKMLLAKIPEMAHDPRYKALQGTCAAIEGSWEEAIEALKSVISVEPKLSHYCNIATAYSGLAQWDKALEYIEMALALENADKRDLALVYVHKCQILLNQSQLDEAMAVANEGLAKFDWEPHLYAHKANIYWQQGRYSEAIDCSEMALSIYPLIAEPYLVLMEIYRNESMYDHVLSVAERAESAGQESPRIKYYKAEALRMLNQYDQALPIMEALVASKPRVNIIDSIYTEMALLKEAMGDLEAAHYYACKPLQSSDADKPLRMVTQASILCKQGHNGAALSIYDTLLVEYPIYVPALVGKGNVYAEMGDIDKAIEYLDMAVSAAEHYEPTYDRIVDILMNASRNEEALNWAILRRNRFVSLQNWIYVAVIYARLGRKDMAEDLYHNKILILYPEASMARRYYGLFLQSNRRYQEAIKQFTLSIELEPDQPDIFESMAYCYQEEKAYDQALEALDMAKAVENPYNEGALAMRRGCIYEDMLRPQEALGQMLIASCLPGKLDGEWEMSWIYTRIGLLHSKYLNDASGAIEYFKRALEKDENCVDAVDYMGDIYMYAYKNYEKAIECYNRKIDKEPEDPHTYVTRALAYKRIGRFIRARRDYKTALALYEKKSVEDPSPCWRVYIANCKLGLKDIAAAKEIFESSLDMPKEPGAWCNKPMCDVCLHGLGNICEEEKKYDKALEYYDQAIEISNSVKHNAARDRVIGRV